MGIQGLTKLLSDNAPGCMKEVKFDSYFGRKVAIDASMHIYQFMAVVGRQGDAQLTNEAGEVTSHLQGMLSRTVRCIEAGIRPIYVFDGKAPELKAGELAKRKEKKEEAAAKGAEAKEAGNAADVEKFGKRNLKVTKEHNEDCKRLLRLLGVPVVEAPCEAEATCAELCKQGKVYAVATEDMDTLTFGSPKLAKNMMKPQGAQLPVTEISYDKALEELKLTKEQFVDMCILCGCDYTDSVRGCGPVTALKLIQEYGSLEGAMEELQSNKKYTLPESFPYEEARRLFLQPDVVDVASMPEFKWTDPDEEGLVAFLVGEKTFNEDRVRKSVEKIRASKGKANQNRLESFFGAGTITHSTLGKRPVDDKAKGKGKAGAAAGAKKPKGVGGVGGKGGK